MEARLQGKSPTPELERSLLWLMARVFRQMQPRKGKDLVRRLSPSKFISLLKSKHQQFDGTQQQDAHELFSVLLNACDDEAKLLFELPSGQPSFVQDVFQGELSSEIRCLTCERVSYRKETFVDLSLDVEHCCSLSQCLQSFTAVETMSGSNKFMCEACNGLQEAHRRCRVRRWPRCLLLQLKRFKVVESGGAYFNKKLNARVEFAREIRLTGSAGADDEGDNGAAAVSGSDLMYSLIGAVVHSGSGANFGHYVTIANVPPIRGGASQWVMFDDDHVSAFSESRLPDFFGHQLDSRSTTAYLLLYERVAGAPPLVPLPFSCAQSPPTSPQQLPASSNLSSAAIASPLPPLSLNP